MMVLLAVVDDGLALDEVELELSAT
jgi:hypothetical protein